MGRSSQAKGRRGEAELTAIFNSAGVPAKIGKAASYGETPDVYGVEGVHCECKRVEHLRLSEWMTQAVRDSEKFQDGKPCIFHRKNREDWLTTMRLSDWLRMYKCALNGGFGRFSEGGDVIDSETNTSLRGNSGGPYKA